VLICSISQLARRAAIAAEIAEASTALDAPGTGNVVFATLVDDPASVGETVDAYLGEIMLEAASATDTLSVPASYDTDVAEAASAIDVQSASAAAVPTTFNPSDLANVTLTNANLTATAPAAVGGVRGTNSHTSGKYYWEYKIVGIASNGMSEGIALASASLSAGSSTGAAMVSRTGSVSINGSGLGALLGTRAVNDVIGVAVDFSAALIWFRVAPSGNWNGSGTADPATGAGGLSISALSGALYPVFLNAQAGDAVTANFGASGFTGSVPSGFTSGF
jgi:hypothetical protein